MLTRMDRDEAIAELRRVKRLRERADAARDAATKATDPAIAAALRVGLRPVEIVAECGVSDSHVRSVRRANKIPPNPSYANLTPPTRTKAQSANDAVPAGREPEPWAEPSPSMRPMNIPTEEQLPTRIRNIHPGQAKDIVTAVGRGFPTWLQEARDRVADMPLPLHDFLIIKQAQDAGILADLGIDLP